MSTFHFQQFSIVQDKSAMKICTDATLFGAMAPVGGGERVLDIGSGCGLLALMLAQLGVASVVAVELTEEASSEARENFSKSPWANQLKSIQADIQGYAENCVEQFDLIISNPPFFDNHTKTNSDLRKIARHTDTLPFSDLIAIASQLLAEEGVFYLLIPTHAVAKVCQLAEVHSLFLQQQVDFANSATRQAKVSTLLFARQPANCVQRRLDIYRDHRIYTEEAAPYLKPFLLRFAQSSG